MSQAAFEIDPTITPTLSASAVIPVLNGGIANVSNLGQSAAGQSTLEDLSEWFGAHLGPVTTDEITLPTPITSASDLSGSRITMTNGTTATEGEYLTQVKPSEAGVPWFNTTLVAATNGFGPELNWVVHRGWNVEPGGGRLNTSFDAVFDSNESYWEPTDGTVYLERHIQFNHGGTITRPWSFLCQFAGAGAGRSLGQMQFTYCDILDMAGTQMLKFDPSSLSTEYYGAAFLRWQTNNVVIARQVNAAGNQYIDLLKLNASNILEVGGLVGDASVSAGVRVPGLTSASPTGMGIGYATGAGGAVTQATDRSTGVTLNKLCGAITTNSASLAAGASATFTVTNSTVAITDTIRLSQRSGSTADTSIAYVSAVAAGSFNITLYNRNSVTPDTGAMILNFSVIKAVAA